MIGIVITAYNRADSLSTLLKSLLMVRKVTNEEIPLVISIDNNGTPEVNNIAYKFNWPFGHKEVIIHKERLGLVKHFIWAGDQTERFENVIFLEDDLIVSPELLNYSTQLIDYYKDKEEVAAASLYNPILNEDTGTRFYQLQDNADVYFLQHPYWGNIWFKEKWRLFKHYMKTYKKRDEILPRNVASWGDKSFKQKYIQYLIETRKTVVIARISVVSNNGCSGLHSDEGLYMYQNVLKLDGNKYVFISPSKSLSYYDAYEEISSDIIKKYAPELSGFDFTVDLNGSHDKYSTKYALTSKKTKKALYSYTSLMKPVEMGVIMGIEGNKSISLTDVNDIIEEKSFATHRFYGDIGKNYRINYGKTLFLYVLKKIIKRL